MGSVSGAKCKSSRKLKTVVMSVVSICVCVCVCVGTCAWRPEDGKC